MCVCLTWWVDNIYNLLAVVHEFCHQLAHNKLRDLDFPTLEQLVKSNEKQRYTMVCDPEGAKSGNDIWWIRANQGHSMKASTSCIIDD